MAARSVWTPNAAHLAAAIGLTAWLAPAEAADTPERWAFDWGGAFHGQVNPGAMGNLAGNGIGLDLSLRARPPRSQLGFRLAGGVTILASTKTRTEGEFCIFGCVPVSGTATTHHTLTRLAAGPQWSAAAGAKRYDLYALAGIASVESSFEGSTVNVDNGLPPATHTMIGTLGADLTLPVQFRGVDWIEIGAEVHAGGSEVFLGKPPIVPVDSRYQYQSERARILGLALRVGTVKSFR